MFSTIQDELNPVEILENVLQHLGSNYGCTLAHHIVSIALRQVKECPDGETADTLGLEPSPSVGGGSSPSQGTNFSPNGGMAYTAVSKTAPVQDVGSSPTSGTNFCKSCNVILSSDWDYCGECLNFDIYR